MTPYKYTNIIFILLLIGLDIGYLYGVLAWWWLLILLIAYIHVLVLGAIYIQWNFYLPSYNKGNDKKYIALSFDDGPATHTAAILDVLKQHNVQAAFFTIGKHTATHTALVKRWHDEGHLIGNHSYNHGFNFDWQSSRTMAEEINRTNEVVKAITGQTPRLFRPPYGVTNPNVAKAVQMTQMKSVGWNVRSFDTKAKDPQVLLNRILNHIHGGDIILLHDSMEITREILTDLILQARKKGFTFARIDKLLDIEAYA